MGSQSLRVVQAMDVRENLSEKLLSARKLTGMSTRAVAEKLAKRFPISHATVANYESGRSTPAMDVLAALADLYDRPINWFLERGKSLTGVRYRNLKSRVKERELHRFEAEVQRWVEAYVAVEQRLKKPLASSIREATFPNTVDADDLSREVRRLLQFSEDVPIPSVVEVLERFRVHVLEQPTQLRIDGLAAKYGEEYIVVLNPTVLNDRVRLNAVTSWPMSFLAIATMKDRRPRKSKVEHSILPPISCSRITSSRRRSSENPWFVWSSSRSGLVFPWPRAIRSVRQHYVLLGARRELRAARFSIHSRSFHW